MTLTDAPADAHTIQPAEAKRIRSQSRGIVIGVCMAFLLMLGNVALGVAYITTLNNYHVASTAKQNEVIALQKQLLAETAENHKLGKSNNTLAKEIIQDSKTVSADAGLVYQQNVAICTALHITVCPGAPGS